MNKVATTHLEIYYESEPYGKHLLRGGVDGDLWRDQRFEDLHLQRIRRFQDLYYNYYKFNQKESSMTPAVSRLHPKMKGKTEECSTAKRSYETYIVQGRRTASKP